MSPDRLNAFDRDEVQSVYDVVTGGMESRLRAELADVIAGALPRLLAGVVNVSALGDVGARQVMLRVRTLQCILDGFRKSLPAEYNATLLDIGRSIGFNFAISVLRVLRQNGQVPQNYESLLDFWAVFDSSAKLGSFSFELKDEHDSDAMLRVSIDDLFLTSGYGADDPLRHVPMMEGYLEAACDCASFLWCRDIEASKRFRIPAVFWQMKEVEEPVQEGVSRTVFTLKIAPERWREPKDALADGIQALERGEYTNAVIKGRVAIEHSLALLVGEATGTNMMVGKLLDILDELRVASIDFAHWRDTYGLGSGPAHGRAEMHEIGTGAFLFAVWRCLKQAERCEIPPELMSAIRKDRPRYIGPGGTRRTS